MHLMHNRPSAGIAPHSIATLIEILKSIYISIYIFYIFIYFFFSIVVLPRAIYIYVFSCWKQGATCNEDLVVVITKEVCIVVITK